MTPTYAHAHVCTGFDMAVRKMSRGMRARFAVPAHLGYGSEGRMPLIPPDTPLVFDVRDHSLTHTTSVQVGRM